MNTNSQFKQNPLLSHIEAVERELRRCLSRIQMMRDHQSGECWYWQNDGSDHLESMVNGLPVVIRADHLRALAATEPRAGDDYESFLAWYDNAVWGNEDFKEGCWRAWRAGAAQK
jgi:hypothetical protein